VRLAQALANLLINAAKYTDAGGSIVVASRAEGADVVIAVRDSGSGIAPEVLPKVFELFVQGRWSLDRAQSGLGIGLTVVKSIVELHGGSVSAHSAGLGRGSEFVIRLPLAKTDVAAPEAVPPPPDRASTSAPLRVLVVDDNQDAAEMMRDALQLLGCSVTVAFDGTAALTAFTELSPDMVLLDIGLPDIDGYELARRFRKSEVGTSTRLVAVTGYGQMADRVRSQDAGITEHLVKPVDLAVVRGVLARCRE
jgi:CheY-like chemotaxis protein